MEEKKIVNVEVVDESGLDCMALIAVNNEGRAQVQAQGSSADILNAIVNQVVSITGTLAKGDSLKRMLMLAMLTENIKDGVLKDIAGDLTGETSEGNAKGEQTELSGDMLEAAKKFMKKKYGEGEEE